eukprot:TRINITY_DN54618_c0_g1_i1.p1 TRINITY_DN54618_c0_g1~~TRINITY_DN54618_c0_g1_i1.p1  ORF type:complete len:838 (-),score=122.87 TRINITY_DN54618_c0_g1_i1:214-2355(-)
MVEAECKPDEDVDLPTREALEPSADSSPPAGEEDDDEGHSNFSRKLRALCFFLLPFEKEPGQLDFEDNSPEPIEQVWKNIDGRAKTSESLENEFPGIEWAFQRFTNRLMQLGTIPGQAWYKVSVDGNEVGGINKMHVVVILVSLGSPILFIVAFFLGFFTIVTKGFIKAWSHVVADGQVKIEDHTHLSNRERVQKHAERARKWLWEHWEFLKCAWYFWLALMPWLVLCFGRLECIMDTSCKDVHYHLSWVVFFFPWAACVLAAFRFTFAVCDSACDCACEAEQQRLMSNHLNYMDCVDAVLSKLSDPCDSLSFFPTFTRSANSKPVEGMPLETSEQIFVTSMAMLCAAVPSVFMFVRYHESPLQGEFFSMVIVFTGTLGLAIEFRLFLLALAGALHQFNDAVKEVIIFVYISASKRMKQRPSLRNPFKAAARRNDVYRWHKRDYFNNCRTSEGEGSIDGFAYLDLQCPSFWPIHAGRFVRSQVDDLDAGEMARLREHQVVFNFSVKNGVLLFRRIRDWLRIDILCERSSMELFVNVSIVLILSLSLVSLVVFFHYDKITALLVFVPVFCSSLIGYLVWALNLCVQVNDFLFEWQTKILFDWKDAAWNDEKAFGAHTEVGWIWDGNGPKALRIEEDPEEQAQHQVELFFKNTNLAAKILQNTNKRIELLEEKQQVLGLTVTSALRTKVLVTIASLLVPTAWKFILYIHNNHHAI